MTSLCDICFEQEADFQVCSCGYTTHSTCLANALAKQSKNWVFLGNHRRWLNICPLCKKDVLKETKLTFAEKLKTLFVPFFIITVLLGLLYYTIGYYLQYYTVTRNMFYSHVGARGIIVNGILFTQLIIGSLYLLYMICSIPFMNDAYCCCFFFCSVNQEIDCTGLIIISLIVGVLLTLLSVYMDIGFQLIRREKIRKFRTTIPQIEYVTV